MSTLLRSGDVMLWDWKYELGRLSRTVSYGADDGPDGEGISFCFNVDDLLLLRLGLRSRPATLRNLLPNPPPTEEGLIALALQTFVGVWY